MTETLTLQVTTEYGDLRPTLNVKRLHPDARLPTYGSDGAACFDLYAVGDFRAHPNDQHAAIFRTGLAVEVPAGCALMIYSRSGHGFNDAIRLSNCVGVIDSDYRGEIQVALRFDASGEHRSRKVRTGDRIAQAMLVRAPQWAFNEVDELGSTARGAGGLGSTGN